MGDGSWFFSCQLTWLLLALACHGHNIKTKIDAFLRIPLKSAKLPTVRVCGYRLQSVAANCLPASCRGPTALDGGFTVTAAPAPGASPHLPLPPHRDDPAVDVA